MLIPNLIYNTWQHDNDHSIYNHLEISKYQQNKHHIIQHLGILNLVAIVIFREEDNISVD